MSLDDYIKTVEEMLAQGEKVTLQSVRNKLGKGSFSTIAEAIKIVLNRGLIPAEVSGPVPEELIAEVQRIWQSACKLASERVASERLALHSARIEIQDSHREIMALADDLSKQVDDLSTQLESAIADKIAAEKRAFEAESALKATKQLLKELGISAKAIPNKWKGTSEETIRTDTAGIDL